MEVKKQRLQILQNRLNLQVQKHSQALIGSDQKVLVTGPSKKNPAQWSGRTECNRVVNFDGPQGLQGQILAIHITEALPNSLRGRLVEESCYA